MLTLTTSLWACVGALAIGTAAATSNQRRTLNRALCFDSFVLAAWLLCLHAAVLTSSPAALRVSWAVASFIPLGLSLLRDIILRPSVSVAQRLRWLGYEWSLPAAGLAIVCTPWFVSGAGDGRLLYGPGYYTLLGLGLAAQLAFSLSSYAMARREIGARRLDLQLLLLGGAPLGFMAFGLAFAGAWFGSEMTLRLMPLIVMTIFGGLVWSLLTTKLLHAKHILTLGVEKLVLVASVATFLWGIEQLALQFVPEWLALGIAVALGLWFGAGVRPWLQQVSQRKVAAERLERAAVSIARKELRPEAMEDAFSRLLCTWGTCDRALILMASQGRLVGGGVELPLDLPEVKLLHALRWVTPERLERERLRPHGPALAEWMQREGLGVVVASAGPSLSFAVALASPTHHRPYTYPEITQLLALESIIESALSRAHYLTKAQHAEQLATVGLLGASIAHEIRNPLVTIKTFVQLLPLHYHDQNFRDKFFRLIGDEVGRIDRMTEQLLDLSAPRVFSAQEVAIHLLLSTCVDLIAAKAEDKQVQIITDFKAQPDLVHTDPNAVKQVVLNLGFNAIQALESQEGPRWLRLGTSQVPEGVELTITDNGPGIAPEVWSRLFQPFQSTKSSGFGLGLAICKDILSSLHASITADAPSPGCGATFRIILPCQPPTS